MTSFRHGVCKGLVCSDLLVTFKDSGWCHCVIRYGVFGVGVGGWFVGPRVGWWCWLKNPWRFRALALGVVAWFGLVLGRVCSVGVAPRHIRGSTASGAPLVM